MPKKAGRPKLGEVVFYRKVTPSQHEKLQRYLNYLREHDKNNGKR